MGHLKYGSPPEDFEIDDRALAHLKIVMLLKLRRHEGFPLALQFKPESGSGRETLWVHPSVQLSFRFDGSRPPALNKDWLELLMSAANSNEGLRLIQEPGDGVDPTDVIQVYSLG